MRSKSNPTTTRQEYSQKHVIQVECCCRSAVMHMCMYLVNLPFCSKEIFICLWIRSHKATQMAQHYSSLFCVQHLNTHTHAGVCIVYSCLMVGGMLSSKIRSQLPRASRLDMTHLNKNPTTFQLFILVSHMCWMLIANYVVYLNRFFYGVATGTQ